MRLALFDVDGTLTPPRLPATQDILYMIARLRAMEGVQVGFVGGSDLAKQQEQLGKTCVDMFDYCFAENGLTAYRHGVALPSQVCIYFGLHV